MQISIKDERNPFVGPDLTTVFALQTALIYCSDSMQPLHL